MTICVTRNIEVFLKGPNPYTDILLVFNLNRVTHFAQYFSLSMRYLFHLIKVRR